MLTPGQKHTTKVSKKNSRTSSLRDNSFTAQYEKARPFKTSVINNFLSSTQIVTTSFKPDSGKPKPATSFSKFMKTHKAKDGKYSSISKSLSTNVGS